MSRWVLFLVVALMCGIGVVLWARLPEMPDPGIGCGNEAIFTTQVSYAQTFRLWVLWRSLGVACVGALLIALASYLQLFHKTLRKAGTFWRSALCWGIAILLGSVAVQRAISFAAHLDKDTCLYQALQQSPAARQAALSSMALSGLLSWQVASCIDLLCLCLLGILLGQGAYLLLRRTFSL